MQKGKKKNLALFFYLLLQSFQTVTLWKGVSIKQSLILKHKERRNKNTTVFKDAASSSSGVMTAFWIWLIQEALGLVFAECTTLQIVSWRALNSWRTSTSESPDWKPIKMLLYLWSFENMLSPGRIWAVFLLMIILVVIIVIICIVLTTLSGDITKIKSKLLRSS